MSKTGLKTALMRTHTEVMLLLTLGAAPHGLIDRLCVRAGHHLMRSRMRQKWRDQGTGWLGYTIRFAAFERARQA